MKHNKKIMKFQELKQQEFYQKPKCFGDIEAKKLLNHYLNQRKKILNYKGKSKVDKKQYAKFEKILISNTEKFWWNFADKKYINQALWFLRRLKTEHNNEKIKDIFGQFYLKLSYWRRFSFNSDKELIEIIKKLE
ncbi:MAG: hypothetical protein KGY67_00315 [Candidatus Thermoplasmatota archaeon]|nr:hypothetical protein [Candidatus Thermoplasmatota archaeon]